MKLAVINYDLGNCTLHHARHRVSGGGYKWVLGRLATLRLVPVGYIAAEDEIPVVEMEPGVFVPGETQ